MSVNQAKEMGETKYPELKKGDRVYFASEKKPYTVKAVGGQFAICTKPFNLRGTYFYTIIDFKEEVRGPNDLVFNMCDYGVEADVEASLRSLMADHHGISRRNSIFLDLVKVVHSPKSR